MKSLEAAPLQYFWLKWAYEVPLGDMTDIVNILGFALDPNGTP